MLLVASTLPRYAGQRRGPFSAIIARRFDGSKAAVTVVQGAYKDKIGRGLMAIAHVMPTIAPPAFIQAGSPIFSRLPKFHARMMCLSYLLRYAQMPVLPDDLYSPPQHAAQRRRASFWSVLARQSA